MKRLAAIPVLCALFATAFAAAKGEPDAPRWPDSLRSVWFYTEGIKLNAIHGDSLRAREYFTEAIRRDSSFAPAYYALATDAVFSSPERAVTLARRACELDSANKWYRRFFGQALLYAERYDDALGVYRTLTVSDPKDPDNYRLLAALYEQAEQPFSAIATIDSAELRFGRIPLLAAMKRRLLIETRQYDKALEEAEAIVEATPYEARHHAVLAEIYGSMGKDSLARAAYDRALQIDSTDITTLVSLSDFYNSRHDFRSQLGVTQRLFRLDAVPLETKILRFEQYTADMRFYRQYFIQINDLASTLAIRYPQDKRVVELYAKHLIASGDLQQALALYKIHTEDTPPDADYFKNVIDIESYLQRPDSAARYIDRAIVLFPDMPEFQISRGHVMSYNKQYDKAISAYTRSLRHAGTDSLRGMIWGYIGDVWHQKADAGEPAPGDRFPAVLGVLGKKASIRKSMKMCYMAYDKSLRYFPDNASVLNNYAYFLAEEGRDLEKALAMATRATALSKNNPTFMDTNAWVLHRLGRPEEAKQIMQQAIALDRQENSELLLHYGDILYALGERFMAETYWRKALEKGYDAAAIERRIAHSKESPPSQE